MSPKDGGGTGAALGTEVLRYSGLHSVAVVISNAITFATTILIASVVVVLLFLLTRVS